MTRRVTDDDRRRLADLLTATHSFPGPFFFSVIAHAGDDVSDSIRGAFAAHFQTTIAASAWSTRSTGAGRYVSHRITLECESSAQVLAMYDRLRTIAGVVAVL